jgi:hypothetical protein
LRIARFTARVRESGTILAAVLEILEFRLLVAMLELIKSVQASLMALEFVAGTYVAQCSGLTCTGLGTEGMVRKLGLLVTILQKKSVTIYIRNIVQKKGHLHRKVGTLELKVWLERM